MNVDRKRTAKQLRQFFKQEVWFIFSVSEYWDKHPTSSPTDMPKIELCNDGSPLDEMRGYTNSIIDALGKLSDIERSVIWWRYIKKEPVIDAEQRFSISGRRIQEIAQQGLVRFADAFVETYDFRVEKIE
jgi:DNA-directed RNA polymerase specialized sigma subunit